MQSEKYRFISNLCTGFLDSGVECAEVAQLPPTPNYIALTRFYVTRKSLPITVSTEGDRIIFRRIQSEGRELV